MVHLRRDLDTAGGRRGAGAGASDSERQSAIDRRGRRCRSFGTKGATEASAARGLRAPRTNSSPRAPASPKEALRHPLASSGSAYGACGSGRTFVNIARKIMQLPMGLAAVSKRLSTLLVGSTCRPLSPSACPKAALQARWSDPDFGVRLPASGDPPRRSSGRRRGRRGSRLGGRPHAAPTTRSRGS
jgi:hypothetical protein